MNDETKDMSLPQRSDYISGAPLSEDEYQEAMKLAREKEAMRMISRDLPKMRRILRDHRAMEAIRRSKDKPWKGVLCTPDDDGTWCASPGFGTQDAPDEDERWNQVHDDPADAIIAALKARPTNPGVKV